MTMRAIRWPSIFASLVLFAALADTGPARAADLTPKAFAGTYQGSGVADDKDSLYFAVTARDMDVVIRTEGAGGFSIAWTTVIHAGGDPAKPDIRKRAAQRSFMPTKTPGVFRATDSGDPLGGGVLSWARIKGNTLSVFEMLIDREGTFELQKYDRTISGAGMELVFTRLRDGAPVRTVKARLARIGN